ncbi:bifunctional 5,10-methylenetetrahydrofolate dehydrogenase/5,10-methenyltetrahydrofolate cyclohydrolase [Candidatus Daviesbacteria bacterium]|nr:bifunctional 5,10-methylenetetrahydrofolate dehydrogenase/5,10-methenyltetrahydrofolate cyclohydrolase [Candidatus Daviesbacteria bacterium]
MRVSGKEVADAITKKLQKQIEKLSIKPCLAIILTHEDPASRLYVDFKIKRAEEIGVAIKYFEFTKDQLEELKQTIKELNEDREVHGIIIQYPIYKEWDFDELVNLIDPKKDVDGFLKDSPYKPATAQGIWEMLTAFAFKEGFSTTEDFLTGKKIVILGRGRTAGKPTRELLESKGFNVVVVTRDTENPQLVIKSGDVVISATGVKNIVNESNLKEDAYVVGVGVGKEVIGGLEKTYGDINEEEVSKIAKLYCPTIGGIGPLTIISLLKNTIDAASHAARVIV